MEQKNINHSEQTKTLWLIQEDCSLIVTATALYFYLLEVNNKCKLLSIFNRNNAKVCADLNRSYKTLEKARRNLKAVGLIEYQTQNGCPTTKYSLGNFTKVRDEVKDEVRDELIKQRQRQKLNKENNSSELISPPPKKKSKFVPNIDFIPLEYQSIFKEWLNYKAEINNSYKSQRSVEKCFADLLKLSNNTPHIAKEIIDKSISSGWRGLFSLKKDFKNTSSAKQEANERAMQQLAMSMEAREQGYAEPIPDLF